MEADLTSVDTPPIIGGMNKCRCGHGRQWHKLPMRVSGWQRARGEKPKRLGCRFRTMGAYPDPRVKACKCRDWHPVEVPA